MEGCKVKTVTDAPLTIVLSGNIMLMSKNKKRVIK